jgi:hypothetical protein
MKSGILKRLSLIQIIILGTFTIIQESSRVIYQFTPIFDYTLDPNIYLIFGVPLNDLYMWISLIMILVSAIQLYLLKIRSSLMYGLTGSAIFLYAASPAFLWYNIFYIHIILPLFSISCMILIFYSIALYLFLIVIKIHPNDKEKILIRNVILDLEDQFTRLEVREIAEESKVDRDTVIKEIIKMINNNEINAEYFKSTKTLAFYQEGKISKNN